MISLSQHDRIRRSVAPSTPQNLPTIEQRAAMLRQWAAQAPAPAGMRRVISQPQVKRVDAGSGRLKIDKIVDGISIDDEDLASVRAFAEKMLR